MRDTCQSDFVCMARVTRRIALVSNNTVFIIRYIFLNYKICYIHMFGMNKRNKEVNVEIQKKASGGGGGGGSKHMLTSTPILI